MAENHKLGLTKVQEQFLAAYRETHNLTKAALAVKPHLKIGSARNMGSKLYKQIVAKCGDKGELLDLLNIGYGRLVHELKAGLTAFREVYEVDENGNEVLKKKVTDSTQRANALKLLAEMNNARQDRENSPVQILIMADGANKPEDSGQ